MKGRLKFKADNKEAAERACSPCSVMKDVGSEMEVIVCQRLLVAWKFAIKEESESDVVARKWCPCCITPPWYKGHTRHMYWIGNLWEVPQQKASSCVLLKQSTPKGPGIPTVKRVWLRLVAFSCHFYCVLCQTAPGKPCPCTQSVLPHCEETSKSKLSMKWVWLKIYGPPNHNVWDSLV